MPVNNFRVTVPFTKNQIYSQIKAFKGNQSNEADKQFYFVRFLRNVMSC